MSARSHSKWNRTLTWMLSAALIVQGGAVASASDFGSEVSAETTEEAPQTVEMEEEAGSEPEFADDASGSTGETTDEGNNEPNVESREGDDAAEGEIVCNGYRRCFYGCSRFYIRDSDGRGGHSVRWSLSG